MQGVHFADEAKVICIRAPWAHKSLQSAKPIERAPEFRAHSGT